MTASAAQVPRLIELCEHGRAINPIGLRGISTKEARTRRNCRQQHTRAANIADGRQAARAIFRYLVAALTGDGIEVLRKFDVVGTWGRGFGPRRLQNRLALSCQDLELLNLVASDAVRKAASARAPKRRVDRCAGWRTLMWYP